MMQFNIGTYGLIYQNIMETVHIGDPGLLSSPETAFGET